MSTPVDEAFELSLWDALALARVPANGAPTRIDESGLITANTLVGGLPGQGKASPMAVLAGVECAERHSRFPIDENEAA